MRSRSRLDDRVLNQECFARLKVIQLPQETLLFRHHPDRHSRALTREKKKLQQTDVMLAARTTHRS